jgi:membrane fusion protein (multidrug efflux system)
MFRLLLLFLLPASIAVGQKPPSKPPAVRVATVQVQTLADRIEALGTLSANESVDLTAKVTETITMLNFSDGQRVKQGDVLAGASTKPCAKRPACACVPSS